MEIQKLKQIVYLPANGKSSSVVCYDHNNRYDSIVGVVKKEGYFFTAEQLNQLLSDVIKDTLNTAAENIEADLEPLNWLAEKHLDSPLIAGEDYEIGVSRSAIKNLFEEIFKKFKV